MRLIVVTDNERILGLGDLGAGGMAIPIGKLALYTGACGIYPGVTLPVSLDVGTDNAELLADPLYIGYRAPRLRGAEYDALVDAFVEAVQETWPGCVIQWEDFKQHNALRILDRYRDAVPSFNDDIQGTAAVVLAGVLAAGRMLGRTARCAAHPPGRRRCGRHRDRAPPARRDGGRRACRRPRSPAALALVDSRGLVHADRDDLDDAKRSLASRPPPCRPTFPSVCWRTVVAEFRPTVLVGTTGVAGTFGEAVIRAMAASCHRPVVMPLSNPTIRPRRGRSTSPLDRTVAPSWPPAARSRRSTAARSARRTTSSSSPGSGSGAIVSGARRIDDAMVVAAARTLADAVDAERLADGIIFPPISGLRSVARNVALAVARQAVASGVADHSDRLEADIDAAMWWPEYVPYRRVAAP